MQLFEWAPEDATVNLCMGAAYLQHACSRTVGDRHACVLKALAFFCRHASFCPHRQQAAFNLGRAMHQLGMNSFAATWYERALVLGMGLPAEDSLSFEAGHNLALLYEESGSGLLARHVRNLYCSV